MLDARVEFDFREWGKLQMALAGGSEHMNVLASDPIAAAQPSTKVYRVGWLATGDPPTGVDRSVMDFQQGMRDLRYVIDKNVFQFTNVAALADALKRAAGDAKEPVVIINADANATHQSVIHVMEAARMAGLIHITFATQTPTK